MKYSADLFHVLHRHQVIHVESQPEGLLEAICQGHVAHRIPIRNVGRNRVNGDRLRINIECAVKSGTYLFQQICLALIFHFPLSGAFFLSESSLSGESGSFQELSSLEIKPRKPGTTRHRDGTKTHYRCSAAPGKRVCANGPPSNRPGK